MTIISSVIPTAFRDNVMRSFTKTEKGFSTDFSNVLRNGGTITGGANVVKNEDGSTSVTISRTGPNGTTSEVTKEISVQQKDDFNAKLNQLGQKLAENPKTLPNGYLANGSFLLRITA